MAARKRTEGGTAGRRGGEAPPGIASGRRGARTLAEIAAKGIEPALLRRAGLTVKLLGHWSEIAGPELALRSRPLRVKWGRRPHWGEAPAPGTLVIACDGGTALTLQHQSEQVIERVNATFGWRAIGKIAIEQRPVEAPPAPAPPAALPPDRERRIASAVRTVEHDRLRLALKGLGEAAARHGAARERDA